MMSPDQLAEFDLVKDWIDKKFTPEEEEQMIKQGKLKTLIVSDYDPDWQQKIINFMPEVFSKFKTNE
jgi:hypothetical protein